MDSADQNRIKAVIGLGNPGKQYENTRHNIGFKIIDAYLASLKGDTLLKEKYFGIYCFKNVNGEKMHFLKPITYMNLSGDSVRKLASAEEIKPEEILVIHDDMDYALGKVRLKKGGGSAGHNGIESIIQSLESADFVRLRVGIGRIPGDIMRNHVLDTFNENEKELVAEAVKLSVEAVKLTLARGIHLAMNVINAIKIDNNKKTTGEQN